MPATEAAPVPSPGGAAGAAPRATFTSPPASSPSVRASAAVAATLPPIGGLLLLTRDDGLYRRDLASGKETKLVGAPEGHSITFPAWSPDGRHFAYVVSRPFAPGSDWGDDLFVADADGRNAHVAYRHDGEGTRVESPTWLPDGSALLFGYLRLDFDRDSNLRDQFYDVRRLRLSDAAVSVVLNDAGEPQLCADGSRFVFIGRDRASNTWASVGVAAQDGSGARRLVGVDDGLLTFYAPVPSPDCSRVVFAAVSAVQSAAPQSLGMHDRRLRYARGSHDSPWDLWVVDLGGSGLHRLTQLAEDQPDAAWADDGSRLLFIGTNALYEVRPDGSGLRALAGGLVHGQLAWWQGR